MIGDNWASLGFIGAHWSLIGDDWGELGSIGENWGSLGLIGNMGIIGDN